MIKRQLHSVVNSARQMKGASRGSRPRVSTGAFAWSLITVFLAIVAITEIIINFFKNDGLTTRSYTLIVLAVIAGGLLYFQREPSQSTDNSVTADAPSTRLAPEIHTERVAMRSNNSFMNLKNTTIANHDIGINATDSDIHSDNLKIR